MRVGSCGSQHAGVKGNEIVDKIAKGSLQKECRLEYYSVIREGLEKD